MKLVIGYQPAKFQFSLISDSSFTGVGIMSQSIPTGNIPPELAQKTCPEGRDLAFESCPAGAGNSPRTEILWKMKV